jgi:hypothetical protein
MICAKYPVAQKIFHFPSPFFAKPKFGRISTNSGDYRHRCRPLNRKDEKLAYLCAQNQPHMLHYKTINISILIFGKKHVIIHSNLFYLNATATPTDATATPTQREVCPREPMLTATEIS